MPTSPNARCAIAGSRPGARNAARAVFFSSSAALAFTRRRLCLTPDRDQELAAALGDRLQGRNGLWSTGPPSRTFVTLWWDVSG